MDRLQLLPSARVWEIFLALSKVPRSSGHEQQIANWITHYAGTHGLTTKLDETGNVILIAKASQGKENVPPIAFQGHMDMVAVCDKGYDHDFEHDGLELDIKEIDGEPFIFAHHTTLGADDGIGIAIALAIMTDPEIAHGPMEALFTVGEETSMQGMINFPAGLLASKMMINIDSEKDDEVTIGCAGGSDASFTAPLKFSDNVAEAGLKITFSGFSGGHSGIEIHKGRANAIICAAQVGKKLAEDFKLSLTSIDGGTFRNAIPTHAHLQLGGTKADVARALKQVDNLIKALKDEFAETDSTITVIASETEPAKVISQEDTLNILDAISTMPDGVLAWSMEFEDVVESSSNLGIVSTKDTQLQIVSLMRSMDSTTPIKNILQEFAKKHHFEVEFSNDYPGWKPSSYSKLLKMYEKSYEDFNFVKPKAVALHAGVECGIMRGKYPDMDIISIGPNIIGAHTTQEMVSVPSVEKIYGLVLDVMDALE